MELKLALFFVTVYCINITSQRRDQINYLIHKKRCDQLSQLQEMIHQTTGIVRPIKKNCMAHSTTVMADTTVATTTPQTTQATTPCTLTIPLVELHRLYCATCPDHFYTMSSTEADNAVTMYGYAKEGSPGRVAMSTSDCQCGASLKPVYRLIGGNDHFYTLSDEEATNAVANYGYTREGIGWYCSEQKDYCGATLALNRYYTNNEHFYTTNPAEASGTPEGTTCYIWPI